MVTNFTFIQFGKALNYSVFLGLSVVVRQCNCTLVRKGYDIICHNTLPHKKCGWTRIEWVDDVMLRRDDLRILGSGRLSVSDLIRSDQFESRPAEMS